MVLDPTGYPQKSSLSRLSGQLKQFWPLPLGSAQSLPWALFHESWTRVYCPSGGTAIGESRCHWTEYLICKGVFDGWSATTLKPPTSELVEFWLRNGPIAPDKELKVSTCPPLTATNSKAFIDRLFGLAWNQMLNTGIHNQHPITYQRLPQGWVRLVDSLFCTWVRLGQRNWLVCWREMKMWLVRVQAEIQMRRFGLF